MKLRKSIQLSFKFSNREKQISEGEGVDDVLFVTEHQGKTVIFRDIN
jgi:hypothetical protein